MTCDCEKDKFPAQVVVRGVEEKPVLFKLVRRPADFGTDEEHPPVVGEFRNVLLNYEANNHTYIFSSDGIPVLLTGTAEASGSLDFDELLNRPKYGGATMTSSTDIPDLTDTIASLTVEVNGKQAQLTAVQLDAVNSGITSADVAKLSDIPSDAEANTIDSISVNGVAQTPDANKNVDLAIDEGIKTLTTADYNYPTASPVRLAPWLLDPGFYIVKAGTMMYYGTDFSTLATDTPLCCF